ncbi:hypothetical protein JRO89_XS07G0060000 [Xanthoceras sorbifolium]|uniref:Uncharacterized protein n=1 Tax=Xanthoceras sorbifolium TaxID=99658 RepID=A0ABQ8HSR2_9ROSI|nr:hypothetical protein JRO89_XS07G0060000 [Xanthoceras sorbifolium]
MASDIVRIALESETKTHKKKVLEEFVWAVYCNGRKVGYSIRRKQMSDDERHVMQLLRGVSMGAGVLPSPNEKETADGELTYMRARFERVVGSKDSEALHMINPDSTAGPELSIFFVRGQTNAVLGSPPVPTHEGNDLPNRPAIGLEGNTLGPTSD